MRLVATTLLAFVVATPAAFADDASLFDAYVGVQPRIDNAGRAYVKAARRFQRDPRVRTANAVIRTDRRINRALADARSAVTGETASSPAGERARSSALREIRAWSDANRLEIAALRAAKAGRTSKVDRLLKRANRMMRRGTVPAGRRAVRNFKAAGFTSPEGALHRLRKRRP